MGDELKRRIALLKDELINFRREFHKNPELSFQEYQTTKKIAVYLTELGLEVKIGNRGIGVAADLKGTKPGPTVALRADIDALPIYEESDKDYVSKISGVMHACGHDGHTAALMITAKILSEYKNDLHGGIRFLFQPAEEKSPGGAIDIINQGYLDNVDYIYGLHLWSLLPVGQFQTAYGPMMANADKFEIKIKGKGGHAGLPHEASDSLLAAANIIVNAQHIVSRKLDPLSPGVLTFGKINAGSNFNVIANDAQLEGTVRTLDENSKTVIKEWLEKTIDHTCKIHGVEYDFIYENGYPTVHNHLTETEYLINTAKTVFGENNVNLMKPIMAGEDFSYYLQKVPGAFCLVGAGNKEKGIIYPHHHPRFDIDEEALPLAVELLCKTALNYLTK